MINITYIYGFLLILVRMTTFFVTAPVFSSRGVPAQFKLGLSFFISLLIYPTIGLNVSQISLDGTYIFLLIQEAVIGLLIGWITQLLLTSIHIAGSFIDMQIGFAIANVIDPQTGVQSPLMGNFKYMFAILLFLTLDGHHVFIDGIVSSYQILSITGEWINHLNNESVLTFILSVFSRMFVIAFQIAAPIVGTLFITDLALGIVARTVPQLNVFVVGLPLKVILNFILLFLIGSSFIYIFKELFQEMMFTMRQFMELMGL